MLFYLFIYQDRDANSPQQGSNSQDFGRDGPWKCAGDKNLSHNCSSRLPNAGRQWESIIHLFMISDNFESNTRFHRITPLHQKYREISFNRPGALSSDP
jgi:hypothetical protein